MSIPSGVFGLRLLLRRVACGLLGACCLGLVPRGAQADECADQAKVPLSELEQRFVAGPSPDFLAQLGRAAQEQNRIVEAADLYLRYRDYVRAKDIDGVIDSKIEQFLKEHTTDIQAASNVQIFSKSSSSFERKTAGAKDNKGKTLIFVDNHPQAVVPSSGILSIHVSPGTHCFSIQRGSERYQTLEVLPPGQAAWLEMNLAMKSSLMTTAARLALLLSVPEALEKPIIDFVSRAANSNKQVLVDPQQTRRSLRALGLETDCLSSSTCPIRLATELNASYLLQLVIPGAEDRRAGARLMAQALDVISGMLIGTETAAASSPADDAVRQHATDLLGQLLLKIQTSRHGMLEITSKPKGATVFVDGRELGVTPFSRAALAGPHLVQLVARNYIDDDESTLIEIKSDEPTPLRRRLRYRLPRPAWRLGLGSLLMGAGLVGVGIGISGLMIAGHCQDLSMNDGRCPYYDTNPAASGSVSAGGAATIAGILTIAIPGK